MIKFDTFNNWKTMTRVNSIFALQLIILFALINSSIFATFHPTGTSRLLIAFLMNLSGGLLVTFFFIKFHRFDGNLYFKTIFTLLILWSLWTIGRSITLESDKLITLFGHDMMGWAWLTPLAIVFGFQIRNWLPLFPFMTKLLLIGSFMVFIGAVFSMKILNWLAFFPFILLTMIYQPRSTKYILYLSIVALIILSIINSTRANALFLVVTITFAMIEFFRNSDTGMYKKITVSLVTILLGTLLLTQIGTIFNKISHNKEATTDTRTFLFKELFADMSTSEEIIGRGAMGTYYSPYFAHWNQYYAGGDSSTRSESEVGYLHMILKGGYVMVTLYLLILLPAAFLGIFRSHNILARMSGYYILAYLIMWGVTYNIHYYAHYLLLWMAVGTAISPSARAVMNHELLNPHKKGHIFATK